tara:strand:+ start:48 stop:1136 length:1089 start_codon:yes stop_codon:yes gene_type:complete
MRILVTGGAGYIGSHTVKALIEKGHNPVIIDNLIYGHENIVKEILKVPLIIGQIGNFQVLKEILLGKHASLKGTIHEEKTIEAVMHFAAYAYVGESVSDPLKYYKNNVVESIILLDALCDKEVISKTENNLPIPIVFSSTCATYGNPDSMPITEETYQNPINPYGRSKLFIEKILQDLAKAVKLRSVILRYFNAAGASPDLSLGEMHEPETHLIPLVIQTALGIRDNVKIFGNDYDTPDGTCLRDFIHVCDLADAHVKALSFLEKSKTKKISIEDEYTSEIFNLGNGNGVSVKEIIKNVEEISNVKLKVIESKRRDGDPPILIASSKKINNLLGWKPKYPNIKEIIKHAYYWHKKILNEKIE